MKILKQIFRQIYTSKKNLVMLALIIVGVGFLIGVEAHKSTLLSPGPLSAMNRNGQEIEGHVSHAEFEEDCSHCHGPIHCVIDTKCQDCHVAVAQQRADNSGLHGVLPGAGDCEICHQEHQGRDEAITSFAYANIDHQRLAGFSLVKHRTDYQQNPMTCQSCHSQDTFATATLDCVSCHAADDHDALAAHIELYGADCLACHDGADRYTDFDHAQVYPLDGAHADTDCTACHQDQIFEGTPQDCYGCHQDKPLYAEIFGNKCERCHSTTAWVPTELKAHTFLINHGAEGETLACETCHEHTYTQYPCYSCHDPQEMADFHAREDIVAYENCIDCHPTGRENEGTQFLESGSLVPAQHQE